MPSRGVCSTAAHERKESGPYESDQPFSIEALREMVRRELPASIYRCKGIVYVADAPERRAVLQAVGRRVEVSLLDEWDGRTPRTQIVAIGAPGSIDADDLRKRFDACISGEGADADAKDRRKL